MKIDEEIKDIISVWRELVETKIIPVVKNFNTYYEGNIFSLDHKYDYNPNFLDKQKNIIILCKQPNVKNVLNIGFNSGNSTLLMLLSNPNITITCVDIKSHVYVEPCFNIINNLFKNRIKFLSGNSINILKNLDDKFNLIHIDGSISKDIVKFDIKNSINLANTNGILIMDDYDYEPIKQIWDYNTNLYKLSNCNFKIHDNIYQSVKIKEHDIIMDLHKVVINLERRPDRLQLFKNRCPFNDVEIMYGFDGSKLELEIDNYKANQLNNLSKGEIGCFISHIRCYEYMIKNNIENMLIFEDDCIFCDNFSEKLNNIYNEFKTHTLQDNNIFYIGGQFEPNFFTKSNNCSQISDNLIKHNFYQENGDVNIRYNLDRTTHSYIITKSTALFLLNQFNTNINCLAVDHWLIECFNKFKYNIYSTQPLLCYSPFVGDSNIR